MGASPEGGSDLFGVADRVVGDVLAEDGHEGVVTGFGVGEVKASGGGFVEDFASEVFFDGIGATGEDVGSVE